MSQSSYIVALLLAGFVLFLAARNRLTVYEQIVWGGSGSSGSSTPAKSGSGFNLDKFVKGLKLPDLSGSVIPGGGGIGG